MINRLGLVLHWIGFVCLLCVIGLIIFASLSNGRVIDEQILSDIAEHMFDFDNLSDDTELFLLFWFAVAHWPIKFILTGNTSFFPWKSND